MPGIYIAAVLASLLAITGFGTLIYKLPRPANGWLLLAVVLVCVPLQPLAFYLVRVPLDHWLAGWLTHKSAVYQGLVTLYAPLVEEPAKLLVLLIPAIFRDIRPENFGRYALAIGLGFALGEMGFIAERVTHRPVMAGLPFYQFGGYVSERLMTCVFHSAFVGISLSCLRRRLWLGLGGAMAAHWAANFPISLMAWNVGGLGGTAWGMIVGFWLAALFIGAVVLLIEYTSSRLFLFRLLYGLRHCPECSTDFEPSMLAINFGDKRYEKCPHCRKWLWTKRSSTK